MANKYTEAVLPLVLSLTAGYVDTAGFLALQGLFTAHVTGNFVTLGASFALGTSGAIAKLLALPVFCIVVIAIRLLASLLSGRYSRIFEFMLGLKVVLLVAGAALAVRFGPFHDADRWQAILTGMVLVAAMAIQNAAHRVYMGSAPPSTLMTGTTTQIMIDLADILYVSEPRDPKAGTRISKMSKNVIVFAVGCGLAALLYLRFGVWSLSVPPLMGLLSLSLRLAESTKE